jgi:hypothetical protein
MRMMRASMLMAVMRAVSHRHTGHIMTVNRFSLMCVRGRHFTHEMR